MTDTIDMGSIEYDEAWFRQWALNIIGWLDGNLHI